MAKSKELEVGAKAPDFNLVDQDGKKHRLKDYKGQKVVLYFYPKDLTPGCTQEACDFRDSQKAFQKKKTVVLGVSRDSAELHKKFEAKHDLNFPLLVDEDGKLCNAYGVWVEKNNYGKKYMGIQRATFIIGGDGKIQKIYGKVKVDGHVDDILENV